MPSKDTPQVDGGRGERVAVSRQRVIDAAKRWGDSDADDPTMRLTADLVLSLALIDLHEAEQGDPPTYEFLSNGRIRCTAPPAGDTRTGGETS